MLDVLPVILSLHLKSFDVKPDDCTKIIKSLEFPVDLEVESRLLSSKSQTPDGRKYMLFAVVNHVGDKATRGHYFTDAFQMEHIAGHTSLIYSSTCGGRLSGGIIDF
ncbi:unnamed protein product [Phaedon cochleariae]|uniref:USP domain-containing protein n=1 Tax=Phaedon cochleariae TaxID=80249 RepID=A0A9N9SCD9_PHACE|nr:unnamed protein product [Phaedon cochleariae]